jgi:serine/threonine protein kinase
MPCELARGKRELDVRSDIYSLGATLYHMVTGEVPFSGNSAPMVLVNVMTQPLVPPIQRNPNLSPQFSAVIEKMMAKEPVGRHAAATEVEEDFQALLDGKPPVHTHCSPESSNVTAQVSETSVSSKEDKRSTRLPQASGPLTTQRRERPRLKGSAAQRALLKFLTGQEKGRSCVLARPVTVIGRLPECDIQVQDIWFSRKHFSIHQHEGHYEIEDLGSMNGTRINGRVIRRAELKHGDQIGIYDTLIRFESDEDDNP